MKRTFLTLILLSNLAYAAHWVKVEEDNNKNPISIDTDTIEQINNNTATVWIKFVKSDGSFDLRHYAFKRNRKSKQLGSTHYDKSGDVTQSNDYSEVDDNKPWDAIVPGSIGESIYYLLLEPEKHK